MTSRTIDHTGKDVLPPQRWQDRMYVLWQRTDADYHYMNPTRTDCQRVASREIITWDQIGSLRYLSTVRDLMLAGF